jgi:DNA-binding NtrC family response regulator
MPGFDGMTVLQQVRALNERIPVIILTEVPTGELEHEACLLGATAFMRKSFSIHELGNALSESFEKPSRR